MKKDEPQMEWAPDPGKHLKAWKRIYAGIVESRQAYYSQFYGKEGGHRYRRHTAERDYFYTWGKLPEHVIADNCQVCDREQAEMVMDLVRKHNQRYFDQMNVIYAENVAAYKRRLENIRKAVEQTPEYKAGEEGRKTLMKYADEWIERIRSEMSDIRGDATTKGQQGDAPAQQGAKASDSKEADTNAAEE